MAGTGHRYEEQSAGLCLALPHCFIGREAWPVAQGLCSGTSIPPLACGKNRPPGLPAYSVNSGVLELDLYCAGYSGC